MFVLTTKNTVVDKVLAALVATSMLLWGVGVHQSAQAATLIDVSDLLTDSAPGALSDHTISFEIPTGSTGVQDAGDTIVITFPTGFNIAPLVAADVDLRINGAAPETYGAGDWLFTGTSSQDLILTFDGGTSALAGDVVSLEIGIIAGGANQITNNSATGSYPVGVAILDGGVTTQDTAETVIVVFDTVEVTADVDPIFNFYVNGLPSGYGVNGETTTQAGTTTTVPFGTLDPLSPEIVGQQLRVQTNAISGYSVTVEADHQLLSSNLADIDSFTNGTGVTSGSAVVWASPTGTIGSENTYGHWGMTSDDATLSGGDDFGSALYSAVLTTPQEVMFHTGVADGIVSGQGSTTVAYKAEIMSFQEAADDYTATLTYIATPIF